MVVGVVLPVVVAVVRVFAVTVAVRAHAYLNMYSGICFGRLVDVGVGRSCSFASLQVSMHAVVLRVLQQQQQQQQQH